MILKTNEELQKTILYLHNIETEYKFSFKKEVEFKLCFLICCAFKHQGSGRKKLKAKRVVDTRMSKTHVKIVMEGPDWRREHCWGWEIVRNKIFQQVLSFVINIKTLKSGRRVCDVIGGHY